MSEFIFVGITIILGLGAYWSFSLYPRQRDFAKRQVLARSLAEGDEVITAGGLLVECWKLMVKWVLPELS